MGYLTESSPEPAPKKKFKRWSKEETANGITKSIRVEEVTNGYIITICKYGKDESNPDSKYIDEEVKKISTTNPFEKKVESEEDNDSFDGLMSSAVKTLDNYL